MSNSCQGVREIIFSLVWLKLGKNMTGRDKGKWMRCVIMKIWLRARAARQFSYTINIYVSFKIKISKFLANKYSEQTVFDKKPNTLYRKKKINYS